MATFDFLGFTHYCDKTRKGAFKVGRKTARKKYTQKVKELSQWLKKVRNLVELKEWWQVLSVKLVWHYRYYGISGNMASMRAFYTKALRLVHKWINRRSQKKSYDWRQFLNFVKYNPLPQPKIYPPNLCSILAFEDLFPKSRVRENLKHGSVRGINN